MDKIIDNILQEWAYRVHDGMPNPKNAYHIVQLKTVLQEKKFPPKAIDLLLSKLGEADAEVMGTTVAQAKSKAKKGQTYSSKRAKKVYKKGEEDGGESETNQTSKKETLLIP